MSLATIKAEWAGIPPVKPVQLLLMIGGSILDGFLRGLLEQGIGRASAPILGAIWSVVYLLLYFKKWDVRYPQVDNLVASMLVSEAGELGSYATNPVAQFLGGKAFGGVSVAADWDSKLQKVSSDVRERWNNLVAKAKGTSQPSNNSQMTIAQNPTVILDRPKAVTKRTPIGATR